MEGCRRGCYQWASPSLMQASYTKWRGVCDRASCAIRGANGYVDQNFVMVSGLPPKTARLAPSRHPQTDLNIGSCVAREGGEERRKGGKLETCQNNHEIRTCTQYQKGPHSYEDGTKQHGRGRPAVDERPAPVLPLRKQAALGGAISVIECKRIFSVTPLSSCVSSHIEL